MGEQRGAVRPVGRPPIPTARIVAAALAVLDDVGVDGLSMRAIAERLGSSTATLYRHFPDRGALLDAVVDSVIGEVDLEAEEIRGGGWKAGCRRIAMEYFAALKRHRGVAMALADRTPMGPNGARVRERWLALMLGDGFGIDLAVSSGAMMSSYVQGFAIQYAGDRVGAGLDDEQFPAALERLDPDEFPATAAALAKRALPVSLENEFAFGLELILDGLELLADQRHR